MAGPGDEIAQGVSQGMMGLNPVTAIPQWSQQGMAQVIQLLQQLGLMQPPPQGNPISGVGQQPPQQLKQRMTR